MRIEINDAHGKATYEAPNNLQSDIRINSGPTHIDTLLKNMPLLEFQHTKETTMGELWPIIRTDVGNFYLDFLAEILRKYRKYLTKNGEILENPTYEIIASDDVISSDEVLTIPLYFNALWPLLKNIESDYKKGVMYTIFAVYFTDSIRVTIITTTSAFKWLNLRNMEVRRDLAEEFLKWIDAMLGHAQLEFNPVKPSTFIRIENQ